MIINSIAWNTEELQKQYEYTSSGHWFDKDTMRFFRSRLTTNYVRFNDEMAAFITTEACFGNDRAATIRIAKLEQEIREKDNRPVSKIKIDTFGEFNKMSLAQAKRRLENLHLSEVLKESRK